MCNRQIWIIASTTVIISMLLVTTAIYVYYYIIPQEVEDIEDLKVFVDEFFNELSLSKEIESSNCRCRLTEVKCDKQIHIPKYLQSKLISICSHPYTICCDIEEELNKKIGRIHVAYGNSDTDNNTYLAAKTENSSEYDKNGMKLDYLLNQSLENLTHEIKESNETIFSDLSLETLHNFPNLNKGSDVSADFKGVKDILLAILEVPITEKNNGTNEDDIESIDYTDIDEITRSQIGNDNLNSNHKDISYPEENTLFDMMNDLGLFDENKDQIKTLSRHETVSENIQQINTFSESDHLNSNHKEHEILLANIDKQDIVRCPGSDCIQNDHDEDKNIFIPGFNHEEDSSYPEENTLFNMMDNLGLFNATLDDNKEQIKTLSSHEKLENLNSNHIEPDTLNANIDEQDSDFCFSDDCIHNNQEVNKNISIIAELNSTGKETENKTNLSDWSFFNLFEVKEEDLGFLLPEQDNINSTSVTSTSVTSTTVSSTSVTLYPSGNYKSKSINDHIFYYSYLTSFVYVIGFLADFFIPVFSLAGLAILQFFIFAFPTIIQSQFFDIISPLIKYIYGAFGILNLS